MWDHITNNNLILDNQHGFQNGYNTATQLLYVIHNAAQAAD